MFNFYLSKVKNGMVVRLQYPGNFFVWAFAGIVQPLVLLTVWATVARTTNGNVGGFTSGDFAAYFLVVTLVQTATFTWFMWEFEYRIRGGTFSPLLLLPIHPIHGDVAENIAYKLLNLAALIPAAGLLTLLFSPQWHVSSTDLLLFIPALTLAAILRFLLEWTLALAAFWLVRVTAVNQLYQACVLVLSGQIAPLALFPNAVQVLAAVLPFRYFVAFPAEVLLGRLAGRELVLGFTVQLIWLCVVYVAFRIIWRMSVQRHTAVGA